MIARAAGGENESLGPPQLPRVEIEPAEMSAGVLVAEPAAHGVFQGFGLFVNLLQHEMIERAFVGIAGHAFNLMHGGVDANLIAVEHVPKIAAQYGDLMII